MIASRRLHPGAAMLLAAAAQALSGAEDLPWIDSVALAPHQPHRDDPAVIWYDDFDGPDATQAVYLEPKPDSPDAKRSGVEHLGLSGQSMECFYPHGGGHGVGNRKLVFGDCPFGRPIHPGVKYEEIYWRVYVKHQRGWAGAPDKLTRATGFVSDKWNQAFILHVWSNGLPLTLDPASGIVDGAVTTVAYNDFPHLHWLGHQPDGRFPFHAGASAGRWICVEAHLKLNAPGKRDGEAALWIDGRLDIERKGLDFRGPTSYGINAVFLEAYWNQGSPVDQYRWYDDFVVSTKPIGPLVAEANPQLIRATGTECSAWEAELAADADGTTVVWRSATAQPDPHLRVDATSGTFTGPATGHTSLALGVYFCRLRERGSTGAWTAWSAWHQPFAVR